MMSLIKLKTKEISVFVISCDGCYNLPSYLLRRRRGWRYGNLLQHISGRVTSGGAGLAGEIGLIKK